MNFIVSPKTKQRYQLNTRKGIQLLKSYIKRYQTGGSDSIENAGGAKDTGVGKDGGGAKDGDSNTQKNSKTGTALKTDNRTLFTEEQIKEVINKGSIAEGEHGAVYDMGEDSPYILKVGDIPEDEISIQKSVYNRTYPQHLTPNIVQEGTIIDNSVPSKYIIMDKIVGKTLNELYESIKNKLPKSGDEKITSTNNLKDYFKKEIKESILSSLSEIKICHNDVHDKNIIYGYNMAETDRKYRWYIIDWGQAWEMSELECKGVPLSECGQGNYKHCWQTTDFLNPGCKRMPCLDYTIQFDEDLY
jgi:serine/threonine protein kinase